ncbi:MAG TPA: hypothetical protein VMV32_01730 [Ignavibacteriaceae bacterium]|nr:hypothetical protein [Ignavibacteriaceae bacterium]
MAYSGFNVNIDISEGKAKLNKLRKILEKINKEVEKLEEFKDTVINIEVKTIEANKKWWEVWK